MKPIKVKIEINVETSIDGKPANELLQDIADLCHKRLDYSTSKEEECETLYEDNEYEALYEVMNNRISNLEGALGRILAILED